MALWTSAKYMDRVLNTPAESAFLSEGLFPSPSVNSRADRLTPLVEGLTKIKDDPGLSTDSQKTQAAQDLAEAHLSTLESNPTDFAQTLLDLQIDTYLDFLPYLEQQQQRARSVFPIAKRAFQDIRTRAPDAIKASNQGQSSYTGVNYQLVLDSKQSTFIIHRATNSKELACYHLPNGELISSDGLTALDMRNWRSIRNSLEQQASLSNNQLER